MNQVAEVQERPYLPEEHWYAFDKEETSVKWSVHCI